MKKVLALLISIFLFNSVFSQNKWGVSVGHNWSIMDVKTHYFDVRWIQDISNFNIGAFYVKDLNENVEFQADLKYLQKGFIQKVNYHPFFNDTTLKMRVQLNYIDLPLRINSKIKIGNTSLLFGAGGYFSYGITGKVICESNYPTGSDSFETNEIWKKNPDTGMSDPLSKDPKEIVYASGYTGLHRIDYGLISSVGIDYKNFRLLFEYTYGLRQISIESSDMFNHKVYNLTLNYVIDFSKFKSE